MWFVPVLKQCEEDFIMPIKHLELIWTEVRQTGREGTSGLVRENEKREECETECWLKDKAVEILDFSFFNELHEMSKGSNELILVMSIVSVAKAWFLCGIVVKNE